jgi:hypothetical protein
VAVAFDAVGPAGGGGTTGTVTGLTWAHSPTAGAALLVGVALDQATNTTTCTATFNGVSMTALGSVNISNSNVGYLYLFGIANVAAGSQSVVVTFSGTTDVISAGSVSYTGAGSTVGTAFGTFQHATSSSGTQTIAATSTSSSSQVCGFNAEGGNALTGMSSGTSRFLINVASANSCGTIGGGDIAGTGGTVTLTWSGDTADFGIGAVEVLPAAVGGIAFDAVGPSGSGTGVSSTGTTTTLSWTHTCGAGANVILAAVNMDDGSDEVLTVTCNGTAMTSLGLIDTGGGTTVPEASFEAYLQLFIATGASVNASAGNAIVATSSGALPNGTDMNGGSLSFSGYTGHGTPVLHSGAATVVIPANTSGSIIAGFLSSQTAITQAGGIATGRFLENFSSTTFNLGNTAAATAPATGSSVTITWTGSGGSLVSIGVEMQGVVAVATAGAPLQPGGRTWRRRFRQVQSIPPPPVVPSTTVAAQLATAVGAAGGISTAANAGLATAAGRMPQTGVMFQGLLALSSPGSAPAIGITAGLATGVGAAGAPAVGLIPGLAHGTGTAFAPAVGLTPGLATGVGAAGGISMAADAGLATAVGTAGAPAVGLIPGLATGIGTALAPAVGLTPGLATGIGAAGALAVGLVPGLATGIATALAPAVGLVPGLATGIGAAGNVSLPAAGAVNAGLATGVGAAGAVSMAANAGLASGVGAANAPPVGLTPGLATAVGTAGAVSMAADAGLAHGAGAALAPAVGLTPGLATGVGAAGGIAMAADAGLATGAGSAFAPAVGLTPGLAHGAGIAGGVSTAADAGLATGTGAALAPAAGLTPGLAHGAGAAGSPAVGLTPGLATGAGTAFAPAIGLTPGLATGIGTSPSVLFSVTSPSLEVFGFGTFPQVPVGSVILSVIADVVQYGSDAGILAPSYELWDGTAARIGSPVAGTASTTPGNRDSAVFTGVAYSQLATLRLRIYAGSSTGNSGATVNVDAASLSVSWAPNANAQVMPSTLQVATSIPAPAPSGVVNASVTPGALAVIAVFPAPSPGFQAASVTPGTLQIVAQFPSPAVSSSALVTPGVLAIVPALPAVSDVTMPGWATAEDIPVAGVGTWGTAGNVTGSPDGANAVWTVP